MRPISSNEAESHQNDSFTAFAGSTCSADNQPFVMSQEGQTLH